jgi:translation initiation factor IF-2
LYEHGIVTEGLGVSEGEFGPPVQLIPVSGLTGQGLDDLIEGLALQSEVMNLRADNDTRSEGIVLDSRVEKGLGIVVDMIIRWGSIESGDVLVSGTQYGKVRLLKDINGKPLKKGLPSQPVRVIGFDSVPNSGEAVVCVESEESAAELVARRGAITEHQKDRDNGPTASSMELQSAGNSLMTAAWRSKIVARHSLDHAEDDEGCIRIPIIVKADADGTLAAVREALVGVVSTEYTATPGPLFLCNLYSFSPDCWTNATCIVGKRIEA